MSRSASSRVAATTAQVTPTATWTLQRACACGQHTGGGECESCQRETRDPFQRAAVASSPGLPSSPPDNPPPPSRRDDDARHDFSRISATTVSRLPQPRVQRKVTLNEPGDVYEQEADRIAHRVMRMPDLSPEIRHRVAPEAQRICKECEEERIQRLTPSTDRDEEEEVVEAQASPDVRSAAHAPPSASSIHPAALTNGGAPLSDSTRRFYESRFGYDLSSVRVHTGDNAERMADDLHARAFTYGNHIWFGSADGPRPSFCLAHELVHVVQQSSPPRASSDGSSEESMARAQPHASRAPAGLVQRQEVYWIGREFRSRKENTGKAIQDEIYASRTGGNDVIEEVRIPNAARKKKSTESEAGSHVKFGFADLYLAENRRVIGVYFDSRGNPRRLPVKRDFIASPVVEGNTIANTAEGPSWVRVGEIKPASDGMIRSGQAQVASYLEGIKFARDSTNTWAAQNGAAPWPDGALAPMTDQDFGVHADYASDSATTSTGFEVLLVEWDGESPYPRLVLDPRETLGEPVQGRMFVRSFSGGVWAYNFEPTNLDEMLADPATQARLSQEQAQAIDFAQELQDTVVAPIQGAPVQAMGLRKSDARRAAAIVRQKAPPQVQRARKEAPRLRDTFQLERVIEARGQLRTRFTKEKGTKPFQKVRGIGLMYEAEARAQKAGVKLRNKLPDESQLAIKLKTRTAAKPGGAKGAKGGAKPGTTSQPLSTLFRWFEIWTHPAINTLARIRRVFGSTFVAVGTKIRTLKERIGTRLSQTFDSHAGSNARGTSYGAVALRAIARALKSIGSIIIPQTLRIVVESLVEGVKTKLRQLIPLDVESLGRAVANDFSEFKVIQEKIASLQQTIETTVATLIDGLRDKLAGIKDVISLASKIANMVKWTIRGIQCGTPPGWGCLKLVFSSLTAYIAEKVLATCSLQRDVACATAGLDFVKTGIPKALASAITGTFNDLVGRIDSRLSPLFAEITEVPFMSCSEIGCEGGRAEIDLAFDRLQMAMERKHGTLAAAWMMDSFLEMARLSGKDEADPLTAAEVDALTDLLVKHNVTPSEMQMIVLQAREHVAKGQPLQKVTPQELIDEVERQRQLLTGGDTSTEGQRTGDAPSGGAGQGGTGSSGGTGGGGGGGGTEGTTEEGDGLSTVEAKRAKFDGKIGSKLSRTRVIVENPDLAVHASGKELKVSLLGLIDGESVKRVTDVPVKIGKHERGKTGVIIPYVLQQGVCIKHAFDDVPTFCVDNGATLKMTVQKPPKKKQASRK